MQIYGRTVQARRDSLERLTIPQPIPSTCRVSARVRLQLRASGMNLCYGAITFQQKLRDSRSSRRGVIHLNYHTASKRKTLQIKQNVALMGLEIH